MRCLRLAVSLSILAISAFTPLRAGTIEYVGHRIVGTGTADVSITTDGTIGTLEYENILGWVITVKKDGHSHTLEWPGLSILMFGGSNLSATATSLMFRFNNGEGQVLFEDSLLRSYYCLGCNQGQDECLRVAPNGEGTSTCSPRSGLQVIASANTPSATVANFSWAPTSPTLNEEVQFTDTSTGSPTSWAWTFGDGNTSTVQNPRHAFTSAGSYSVMLTATNLGGSDSETKTVVVVGAAPPEAPNANFAWTPSTPKLGDQIQFTDTSTGTPTAWAWAFGDGGTSALQNPKHTYSMAGTYGVKLTATNAGGSTSKTRTVAVASVTHAPIANFDWSPSAPEVGELVQFTDQSTGVPTSWSWNFGDGGTSTDRSPKHKYTEAGTYDVELTAKNAAGEDQKSTAVSVGATGTMAVTLLDPEPDWPFVQRPTATSSLENVGEMCRGAAADGETWLLVRAETSATAQITFAFVGSNTDFRSGTLFVVGSETPMTSLTVATTSLRPDRHVAYALYEVPKVFPAASGSDWTAALRVRASMSGGVIEETATVTLIRPPLILVHGLWSSGATWDASPFRSRYRVWRMVGGYRENIFRPSYDGTQTFAYNSRVVPNQIADALDAVRDAGYAVRRADVVGHSMGGLLARTLAGSPWYLGNIYRLITLDSPHRGSPLATALSTVTALSGFLEDALGLVDATFSPALRNLATDGISLPTAHVWTHMIAGIDGQDSVARHACRDREDAFLSFWQWSADLALDPLLLAAFNFEEHDVVVPRRSQLAGYSGGEAFVTLMHGGDGIHTCNTKSLAYALRVIQLLNTDPTKGEFLEVLEGVNEFSGSSPIASRTLVPREAASTGLQIVSPSSGATFTPGQPISVDLSVGELTVESVMVVTNGDVEIDDASPFGVTLTAPQHKLGPSEILALARLADGSIAKSEPVPILVRTETAVSSLSVAPNTDLVLRVAGRVKLEIVGTLAGSDEAIVLSDDDIAISYSVPGIAQIVDGELVARAVGDVVITLRRDAAFTQMHVVVKDPRPFARRRAARH